MQASRRLVVLDQMITVFMISSEMYGSGLQTGTTPNTTPADSLNPTGPSQQESVNRNHGNAVARVIKGGSYLCAENYCLRFRPAAREAQDSGLGTSHIGFRTVLIPE